MEAEKANLPFLAALPGALWRCSSLVWLATRHSERLALHPASASKNGILTISASLIAGATQVPPEARYQTHGFPEQDQRRRDLFAATFVFP